jgi:hypothetical protein
MIHNTQYNMINMEAGGPAHADVQLPLQEPAKSVLGAGHCWVGTTLISLSNPSLPQHQTSQCSPAWPCHLLHKRCQTSYDHFDEFHTASTAATTATEHNPCATCCVVRVSAGDRWRINFSRVHWNVTWSEGQQRWVKDPADQPGYNFVWSPQWQVQMHQPETWGWLQFSTTPGGLHVCPWCTHDVHALRSDTKLGQSYALYLSRVVCTQ